MHFPTPGPPSKYPRPHHTALRRHPFAVAADMGIVLWLSFQESPFQESAGGGATTTASSGAFRVALISTILPGYIITCLGKGSFIGSHLAFSITKAFYRRGQQPILGTVPTCKYALFQLYIQGLDR